MINGKRVIVQENIEEKPLVDLSQRINSANVELEDIQAEIEKKKVELGEINKYISGGSERAMELEKEEQATKNVIATLKEEIVTNKQGVADSREELTSIERAVYNKTLELGKAEEQLKKTVSLRVDEEEKLTQIQTAINNLKGVTFSLDAKADEANKNFVEKKQLCDKEAERLDSLNLAIRNKTAQLDGLLLDIDKASKEREEALQSKNMANAHLKQVQGDIAGQETLLAEKQKEVFEVEREINELREEKKGVISMLDEKIAYLGRLKEDIELKQQIGE